MSNILGASRVNVKRFPGLSVRVVPNQPSTKKITIIRKKGKKTKKK